MYKRVLSVISHIDVQFGNLKTVLADDNAQGSRKGHYTKALVGIRKIGGDQLTAKVYAGNWTAMDSHSCKVVRLGS